MSKNGIKKVFTYTFILYCVVAVSFYYLIGEQIRYKDSSRNEKLKDASSISTEITEDVVLEQEFVNKLDKLESVAVVFHNFWREELEGNIYIELYDGRERIIYQEIPVDTIEDQRRTFLFLGEPLENLKDKTLAIRIYSDSPEGKGIALMMNDSSDNNLYINSTLSEGEICFETLGKQKVVLGDYYWPIMGVIGVVLLFVLIISYTRYTKGKNDILIRLIFAINRYEFLINQLVERDFKSKYKRSILGILWSFLNPLLTMVVQFLVFSTLFKTDTKSYPIYLLIGVICFNFFNEATSMSLGSVSGNANLITKVYIPKYIFPLSKTLSSTINLCLSLIPLFLVSFVLGISIHKSVVLMFYFLICLVLFSFGIGLFLSTLMVFFRDVQFLWSVIVQIWMYATPIFYTAEIIPEKYRFILKINPLYHFIGNIRKCFMDGISPEPIAYAYCLIFAFISLVIGSYVFKKAQDRFTLYL